MHCHSDAICGYGYFIRLCLISRGQAAMHCIYIHMMRWNATNRIPLGKPGQFYPMCQHTAVLGPDIWDRAIPMCNHRAPSLHLLERFGCLRSFGFCRRRREGARDVTSGMSCNRSRSIRKSTDLRAAYPSIILASDGVIFRILRPRLPQYAL
ncbi:hypothetical protein BDD12DRAFT_213489 [Trichophaea hybrida]|nr:hypothetical protein BDD12DRAFT_213489 [Trichophaea hybrida]